MSTKPVLDGHCVVGVFDSLKEARGAIETLDESSVPAEQVSLVKYNVSGELPAEEEEVLQSGDNTEKDAAKGAGVGGLVGLLLGAPLLLVPGVGHVLIAGPLSAALTGSIVGGFLGAMVGWGVHEDHVEQYQEKVRQGKLLVVVNGNPEDVTEAHRLLRETAAEEVNLHMPTSADAPEITEP